MNIRIRKLRPSAIIPKHVGGNKRSCWLDLYASRIEVVSKYCLAIADTKGSSVGYHAGDVVKIKFGVAMQLPESYEGYLVPRSSTEKNFGLILTNSPGIIDESFAGDKDEWQGRFLATRDGSITIGDRPAQFRIQEKMPEVSFIEVASLGNTDRGGYGTSGK